MNKENEKTIGHNKPPEPIALPTGKELAEKLKQWAISKGLYERHNEFLEALRENRIRCTSEAEAERLSEAIKLATLYINRADDLRKDTKKPYDEAVKIVQSFFASIIEPAEKVKEQGYPVLQSWMESGGVEKVETEYGVTAYFKTADNLIVDEAKLPREYMVPDMAKIRKALKEKKIIQGVAISRKKQVVVS